MQSTDTGAVHGFDTGPVQRLDRLEGEVQGLRHLVQALVDRLDHPPVQTPVPITARPRIPPVNPCAGTCGSWMRFATNLPH
jgi:hypothetical protein